MSELCVIILFLTKSLFSPAVIETPFADKSGFDVESMRKKQATIYPIRRIGNVSDTTAACLYLASDEASFITGINLPVDGGYLNASIS